MPSAKRKRPAPASTPPSAASSDALVERIIRASMAAGWSIPRVSTEDRAGLVETLELASSMMEKLAMLAMRSALMATHR